MQKLEFLKDTPIQGAVKKKGERMDVAEPLAGRLVDAGYAKVAPAKAAATSERAVSPRGKSK